MFLARRRFIARFLAAAIIGSAVALPLAAQNKLDDLRASGAVGETYDGFLVDRNGKNAATVEKINDKRRDIYRKQAKAEGVSLEAVGQVYAEQIMKKAPKGTWFFNQQQQWVQK